MKKCLYPGTFDPITLGHLDIMQRAASICDHLIVAIFENDLKQCMFSLQDRLKMVQNAIQEYQLHNISVEIFDNLLVNLALRHNTPYIIRGIRNANDFEYEQNLFQINRELFTNGFETLFLVSKNDNKHISSSLVRELILLNGDYSLFVSEGVYEFIDKQQIKN